MIDCVPWFVVVGCGRGGGSCVCCGPWVCHLVPCPFRLSFRCSLRFTRRRGAQLLPSLCTRKCRVGGARLQLTLLHSIATRAAAARLRLGGVAGLVLALHARVGGARLRLMLSQSVAARTAAGASAVGGWAAWRPGSCTRSASEGGQCAAFTYALAQRRGSYFTAAASQAAWSPGPCPRASREEGGALL